MDQEALDLTGRRAASLPVTEERMVLELAAVLPHGLCAGELGDHLGRARHVQAVDDLDRR
jgi:hypothetical protein